VVHVNPRIALILALLCCAAGKRVVPYHPLDVKLGQWGVTETTTSNRVSWPVNREPTTKVFKSCLRKLEEPWTIALPQQLVEDVDKAMSGLPNVGKGCSHRFLESSDNKQEIRFQCQSDSISFRVKALNLEKVKGSIFISAGIESTDMSSESLMIDSSFSAKWIGPDCSK
jgi:hypothetical protein